MTFHTDAGEGVLSVVTDSWQDPPPWTAVPVKLRIWAEPTDHSFMVLISYEPEPPLPTLQGKSEPDESRGELLGAPKGTGFAITM
jgi:hypothetical protein